MDHKNEEAITHEFSHDSSAPRKGGIINTLYPPGPQPGAGGRIKNHCRKFWWCDLLVTAVIALVIVLPIIFVGIPNKAQHDIDKSTLEVTSEEVTSPAPDSLHLRLVNTAKSSSQFHPIIRAFPASLSLKGKSPFLNINIPEIKADAETKIVVDQPIKIQDLQAFTEYTMTTMASDEFEVYLNGKTKVKQAGLQEINVNFNKVIKMKGLNKLQGLQISDLKILSGQNEILSDGSNMIGKVSIPNPSVMTLELGNVTMNLQVDGKSIGTSLIPNLRLVPGNNTLPMQSKVDQIGILTLIKSKYTNAILPLEIIGNSSIGQGGQHLTYYEKAIQANTIKLNLDAGPALKAIGIQL